MKKSIDTADDNDMSNADISDDDDKCTYTEIDTEKKTLTVLMIKLLIIQKYNLKIRIQGM